uniref:ORF093 n=1 Tax=Spodoptera frugiperda granulovirus TaxID=307454 RepID=A0A346QW13_9BBAC|nr:ORF093 [Spodoptera frugiperda granulovirus]
MTFCEQQSIILKLYALRLSKRTQRLSEEELELVLDQVLDRCKESVVRRRRSDERKCRRRLVFNDNTDK